MTDNHDTAAPEGAMEMPVELAADSAGTAEAAGSGADDEVANQVARLSSELVQTLHELELVTAERDALKATCDAMAEAVSKAASTAKSVERKAPKPRKAGPMKDGEVLPADMLLQAIGEADEVELVFSDGKQEVASLPARVITGNAWRVTSAGLQLQMPGLEVRGKDDGVALTGYALFLDGKQFAYRARMDVLPIPAGSRWNIDGDVIF